MRCVGSFPKIRKTFNAASFTFDKTDNWTDAALTKWLAVMRNCLCDRRQFNFYRLMASWAAVMCNGRYKPPGKDWWAKKSDWALRDEGLDPDPTVAEHICSLPQTTKQLDCAKPCAQEAGLSLFQCHEQADLFKCYAAELLDRRINKREIIFVGLAVALYERHLPPV